MKKNYLIALTLPILLLSALSAYAEKQYYDVTVLNSTNVLCDQNGAPSSCKDAIPGVEVLTSTYFPKARGHLLKVGERGPAGYFVMTNEIVIKLPGEPKQWSSIYYTLHGDFKEHTTYQLYTYEKDKTYYLGIRKAAGVSAAS